MGQGQYDLAYSQYGDVGESFYTGLGFGENDIVQLIAFTESASEAGLANSTDRGNALSSYNSEAQQDNNAYAYSTTDATQYFSAASDPNATLDPTSTEPGQVIFMTTTLERDLTVDFRFDYSSLVNAGYAGFYLRVFSTNAFVEGEVATGVVWGASALYTFQAVENGEDVSFSGMTIVGTNNFEVIPEPATTSLFLLGATALAVRRRRFSRRFLRGGRIMNKMLLFSLIGLGLLATGTAQAADSYLQTPVYLMPASPLVDALGEPFPGTVGLGDGGLVEIREVGDGIVAPDAVTGLGDDEANPLLTIGHVGDNTIGRDTGLFTIAITDPAARPALHQAYFARVYDAPDPLDAVLYADSEPFTLATYSSIQTTTRLYFDSARTVDPGEDAYIDSNGDGYTDRQEAYLRSHDSDGDGWSDWFEITHGMDATTKYAINIAIDPIEEPDLASAGVASINALSDKELEEIPWKLTGTGISWTAVSGVTYVVDFAPTLSDPDAWASILTNLADSTDGFVDVSEYVHSTISPVGFFRVKAVPQPGEGPEAE